MRKSQVSTQVFVYLGAAVVAVLILLLGYRSIIAVRDSFEQADINEFKSQFQNTISEMSRQSGSVKEMEFKLPKKYSTVCFASSMENGKFDFDTGFITNLYIRDSIENNAHRNVFVLEDGIIEASFYVDDMKVDYDFTCVTNRGLLSVWIRGKGSYAELSSINLEAIDVPDGEMSDSLDEFEESLEDKSTDELMEMMDQGLSELDEFDASYSDVDDELNDAEE